MLAMPALTREDRQRIVERPTAAAGLEFETGLLDQIVQDAAEAPLVCLSISLLMLWQRRRGRMLTHDGWTSVGQVGTALDCWSDSARAGATVDARLARRLLIRLVRVSGQTRTAIPIPWSDLQPAEYPVRSRAYGRGTGRD